MKKYKIVTQRTLFGDDENRTKEEIIEAGYFLKNREEFVITKENIDNARKLFNSYYNIGDIHYSPVKSISFWNRYVEHTKIQVLGDPYYKLYELVNDVWELVDKHECN